MSADEKSSTPVRVILIHGNGGRGVVGEPWFPAIVRDLSAANIECIAPDFPDPLLARSAYWLPFLENELGVDENTEPFPVRGVW